MWASDFLAELEKSKDEYNEIYYNPKKDEIYLVREVFACTDLDGITREYARYADSKGFGKDIKTDKCKDWEFIGEVASLD